MKWSSKPREKDQEREAGVYVRGNLVIISPQEGQTMNPAQLGPTTVSST